MVTKDEKGRLLEWDRTHIVHPACPIGQDSKGILFEKGKGVRLWDTDGKEYLDFTAQFGAVTLGYGQTELVEVCAEQMQKLPHSTLYYGYSHKPIIECSMSLAEIVPKGLDHFTFTTGGSESVDTALQIARLYGNIKGKCETKIISLYNAYHGGFIGPMTLTTVGRGSARMGIGPLVPDILHAPGYNCYRCQMGKEYPQCKIECAKYLEEIILWEGPNTVAAVIIEPCQSAGGGICPPPEYWPMVREICTKHDVLLIADEVATGFCRTGKMFGVELWNTIPDLMTFAKGITGAYFPFGGVAMSDKVWSASEGLFLPTPTTYYGHIVGAAIAAKTIEIYLRDKIAEHVVEVSKPMYERLEAEFLPLPCVGTLGGYGLFRVAVEIVADKTTKRMFEPSLNLMNKITVEALEKGLLLRTCTGADTQGDRIILDPPLVITKEEIDKGLDILYAILSKIKCD